MPSTGSPGPRIWHRQSLRPQTKQLFRQILASPSSVRYFGRVIKRSGNSHYSYKAFRAAAIDWAFHRSTNLPATDALLRKINAHDWIALRRRLAALARIHVCMYGGTL